MNIAVPIKRRPRGGSDVLVAQGSARPEGLQQIAGNLIVGNGENWLTEMSTSQLKELFALSREAVGE